MIASTLVYFLDTRHPGYDLDPIISKSVTKRIGRSLALDSALAAFTSVVDALGSPSGEIDSQTLRKFTTGLGAMQAALGDQQARYTPETLCAGYILWVCHTWMANSTNISRGHGEGLVHLMGVMAQKPRDDEFLSEVLDRVGASLVSLGHYPRKGMRCIPVANKPQVLESLFNSKVQLFPWIQSFMKKPGPKPDPPPSQAKPPPQTKHEGQDDSRSYGAFDINVAAMLPGLMRHPKQNLATIGFVYAYVLKEYPRIANSVQHLDQVGQLRQRVIQSFLCTIGVTFNAFLRSINPDNERSAAERASFCKDAISLAEAARVERPLAAHHVPYLLVSAWCVAEGDTKQKLRALLEEYKTLPAMTRFQKYASNWKEAPSKLSREIPWMPAYESGEQDEGYSDGEDVLEKVEAEGYEYCCIL